MASIVYCNPNHAGELQVWFGDSASTNYTEHIIQDTQADMLLQAIAECMDKQHSDHIIVVNRAATFTFIRIVATICNTLAYATGASIHSLDQPVKHWPDLSTIAQTPSQYIIPHYAKPPTIS